ncbi:MAG: hypothetical protein HPY74_17470 [Firmicutes bacterium]|nr:hypothetical protein [Bacillota bacterium]
MKVRQLFSCDQLNFIASEHETEQEILSCMAPEPEAASSSRINSRFGDEVVA